MTRRKPGRPAGSKGESRARILDAARTLFAKRGFRGTTMREIATRARVDVALVHYFFESKAKLFKAAIAVPGTERTELADGEAFARFHLEDLFVEQHDAIAAMLRAAVGDPGAVPALRALVQETLVAPVADTLEGPDAKVRAELMGAWMVGLFVCRHMIAIEPLASVSPTEIARRIGPAISAIMNAEANGPDVRRSSLHRSR